MYNNNINYRVSLSLLIYTYVHHKTSSTQPHMYTTSLSQYNQNYLIETRKTINVMDVFDIISFIVSVVNSITRRLKYRKYIFS